MSNSANNSQNSNNSNNKIRLDEFDSIIKKSSTVYGNYRGYINEFIKKQLKYVNGSKFNNINIENNNTNNGNEENNNSGIDKYKKIYLNTYVIPLIYLINSYQYQIYYEKIQIINYNMMINEKLEFIKKFYFNYDLPNIKNLNISIYKNYFITSNNNQNNNNNNNNIINNIKPFDYSKINLIINNLTKIKNSISELLEPYEILHKFEQLENEININFENNSDKKLKYFNKLDELLDKNTTKINKLKKLYENYRKKNVITGGSGSNKKQKMKEKRLISAFYEIFGIKNSKHKPLDYEDIVEYLDLKFKNNYNNQNSSSTSALLPSKQKYNINNLKKLYINKFNKSSNSKENLIKQYKDELKKNKLNSNVVKQIIDELENRPHPPPPPPPSSQKGGNYEFKSEMDDLYNTYMIEIIKDILFLFIKSILDNKNEYFNIKIKLKEINDKKIEFEKDFKKLLYIVNDNSVKNLFNKNKKYDNIILQYTNEIKDNEEFVNEYNQKKNKLEKEIKEQDQLKLKQNKFQTDISNIDERITEIKDKSTKVSGDDNILNKGINLIKTSISSQDERRMIISLKMDYEKLIESKKKKKVEKEKVNQSLNKLSKKEDELKEINKEIKSFTKKIDLCKNKIKNLNNLKEKNNSEFSFNSLKTKFIDFFKLNLETCRIISDFIEENEKRKKQNIFNLFYKNDDKLKTILDLFTKYFTSNSNQSNTNGDSQSTNQEGQSNSDIELYYDNLERFNNQLDEVIELLKIFVEKSKNSNLNIKNLKKNIDNQINNVINYKKSSNKKKESTNNHKQSAGGPNNKMNTKIKLIKEINEYIEDVNSKHRNIRNGVFFSKINDEFENYQIDENSRVMFNNIKEYHDKLIENISNNLLNIYDKKSSTINNTSIKNKFKTEIDYLKTQGEKNKNIINRSKDLKGSPIHVYTYTDSIKYYFIILYLIDIFLYNY